MPAALSAIPSFIFGQGTPAKTPQEAARNRATYEAIVARMGSAPKNVGEGLSTLGNAFVARALNDRAAQGEAIGLQQAKDAFAKLGPNATEADIMAAESNPWVQANPGMSAVAQTLLKRQMDASDPANQLDMQYKRAQIAALQAKPSQTAPTVVELFDETSGQPYKAEWNPQTGAYEKVGGTKAATNGLQVTTNPDGTTSVTMGGTGKPLTEAQGKDVYFINQGNAALPTLDKMGDALTNLGESVGGQAPLFGNYLKSSDYQQAEQAGRQFLNSILRKESGAAISETEDKRYGDAYLPRPGDKPAVLAQKKAARANALLGIKMGLPAPAILAMQQAGVDFSALQNEAAGGNAIGMETPQVPTPDSGGAAPIAVNPTTGEKLVLKDGKWVPVQ